MTPPAVEIRGSLATDYADVLTPAALAALARLAALDTDRKSLMRARIERRAARARDRQRITFLDPDALLPRTRLRVQEARDGQFTGSPIPQDLQRQWIQGTGPAARPNAAAQESLRNVAYAL